jgi:hypothetical protein
MVIPCETAVSAVFSTPIYLKNFPEKLLISRNSYFMKTAE